jgi:hypothetical protein
VANPEGNRTPGKRKPRWVDNIKMDLVEMVWYGMVWYGKVW